jgi:hypothetical protein
MELDWSEQSSHIRTLYRPWRPDDGYEEVTIRAAEAQLGIHLPTSLRSFYRTWGRRRDLTRTREHLLGPDGLVIRAGVLIFCVENQATCYWAVRCEDLEESNPPIVVALVACGQSMREAASTLTWRLSHAHLSDFLDDLTYEHALSGGAVHGGYSNHFRPQEDQYAWLERQWRHATVTPMCLGMEPGTVLDRPFLHVRDGQALAIMYGCSAAVCEAEALDEISQQLQVTWVQRW